MIMNTTKVIPMRVGIINSKRLRIYTPMRGLVPSRDQFACIGAA